MWEHIYDISLGIISCLILTGFGLTVSNTLHMFCVSNRTAVYKTFCKLFYFCQISTLKRSQWAYLLPLIWYAYTKIAKRTGTHLQTISGLFFEMLCVLACHSSMKKWWKWRPLMYCYCHRTFKYAFFTYQQRMYTTENLSYITVYKTKPGKTEIIQRKRGCCLFA